MEAGTPAKEASMNEAKEEFDEVQYMPSIDLSEVLQIEAEKNWLTPIVSYLKDGRLLEGKDKARKLIELNQQVIPTEVHMASHRVMKYQDEENKELIRLNLNLIDEVRMEAEQRTARYKNLMAKQHDAMVKPRHFNIGDLVLKRVSLATKNPIHGKLGPNWEGPYRVINCKREGSYYLEALNGRKLDHHWNVEHLRRYYQ
ncbi:uncharacterized protein LOC136063312 [Quercus suber]|uniref:uncharacterized protein LOC136063312 n=1 Tax=Quercus suber TaxID=58331 RepID=UPI0032DE960E